MRASTRISLIVASLAFIVGFGAMLVLLRQPTEPLTIQALEAARNRWREAPIRSYDLRYHMHGSVYEIRVRDGIVIEAKINGQPPRTGNLSMYTVEGLFDTLAMELENLNDPQGPFAGRRESILMRVGFHEKLGYVERYLRSGGGTARGASMELIDFTSIR